MDRKGIIKRLLDMPKEIKAAEMAVYNAQIEALKAKEALSIKEADLYTEGKIEGKNADIRNALLKQLTITEKNAVATAENNVNLARIELYYLQNEFKMLQTVAYLIEGVE